MRHFFLFIIFILLCVFEVSLTAQSLPTTTLRKTGTAIEAPNALVFSIYLKNTSDSTIQYAGGQYHFDFNKAILNGGTGTMTLVSSGFPVAMQSKNPTVFTGTTPGQLRWAAPTPPGAGNGFLIAKNDSVLVMKVRLATSAATLTSDSTSIKFRVAPMANPVVKFGAYINNLSTELQSATTYFNDGEPGGSAPVTWQTALNINDAGTGAGALTFGQAPSATDGLDGALGEIALPAPPATGTFDARFLLPNSTIASLKDYRNDTLRSVLWTFSFQPSAAGYPLTLKWKPSTLPQQGTVTLKSIPAEFTVNMKTDSMYTLSNTAIASLQIEYKKDGVGVNDRENIIPDVFALYQNYPNPFNPSTLIRFDLPEDSRVTLDVYDILGKRVASLVNGELRAGAHELTFSTGEYNLASGMYIFRIKAGSFSATRKMILMR